MILYLCKMDMINKFLDEYVGDSFKFIKTRISDASYWYSVVSDKKVPIIFFRVSRDGMNNIAIFREEELCNTIGRFFNLTNDESMRYVRNWFGDKLGINKVSDLLKYVNIPPDGNSLRSKETPTPFSK